MAIGKQVNLTTGEVIEVNIDIPQYTPTLEELKREISIAIQNLLDKQARGLRWDDMKSARASAGIPLPANATVTETAIINQAISLAQWYIKVWAKAGELEADGNIYTVDEVLAQLPLFGIQ